MLLFLALTTFSHSEAFSQGITKVILLKYFSFFFKLLFLDALGLCCFAQVFSSCGEQGPLFIAVHGLLITVASPAVMEHGL